MEVPFKQSYKTHQRELTAMDVFNVGLQKCTPLYQWGPGVRNHYLIHYVVSGCGTYVVDSRTHPVQAGDAFLVTPDTQITYYADASDPWEYVWVGFSGTDVPQILQCTGFTRQSPVLRPHNGPAFRSAILRIYDARGADFNHAVRMAGELYCALSLLMNRELASHSEDIAGQYVQKATTYINHHYAYPISIVDIADYVGIDRSHLYSVFKQVHGVSPKEYLTNYRLRKACALLGEPSLSITAVANSVGFENNLYFSKVFRKHMGTSPSQYRSEIGVQQQ